MQYFHSLDVRLAFGAVAFAFAVSLAACESPLEIEAVEMIAPDSVVRVGETLAVLARIPRGVEPTWASSDAAVATVDQGLVLGRMPGRVTISAENDRYRGEIELTVLAPRYTLPIWTSGNVVKVGRILPMSMDVPWGSEPTWSTSDSAIATVDRGVVTGVKIGRVTISARNEGFYGEAEVRVIQAIPDTVEIVAPSGQVKVGESLKLMVDVAEGTGLSWSTTNTNVATVEDGVVSGHHRGKVTISVEADTIYGEIDLEVVEPYRIYAPPELSLRPGMDFLIGEFLTGGSDYDFHPADLDFSSSNGAVATVDEDGLVVARSPGEVEIRVSGPDVESAVVRLTVVGDFDAVMLHDFNVTEVNNRLQAVGFHVWTGQPMLWESGRFRTLNPTGADTIRSVAINDAGQVALGGMGADGAGTVWIVDPDGNERAYAVGGAGGPAVSEVRINERGTVAAIWSDGVFLIRNGRVEALPSPEGSLWGIGLNDDDDVAYSRIVVEDGVARPIAMPAGADENSWAVTGINNGGQIVGFTYVRGHAFGGFRGTPEATTLFPHAALWGMNERGDAVGSTYAGASCSASCHAYFVAAGASEGTSLSLVPFTRTAYSRSINDQGVIAATGSQPYGRTSRSFSLLLIPR